MKFEIKHNDTISIDFFVEIDSELIDKKMSYGDSIRMNRLLSIYIKEYIYHFLEEKDEMLNDEVLHYLIEEYKSYKKSNNSLDFL